MPATARVIQQHVRYLVGARILRSIASCSDIMHTAPLSRLSSCLMDPAAGVEPTSSDSKSGVLPLDDAGVEKSMARREEGSPWRGRMERSRQEGSALATSVLPDERRAAIACSRFTGLGVLEVVVERVAVLEPVE